MSNEIIIVGSCMIDFVSYAPRLPTAGETIHGHKFVTNFGGKGANQCVAAAKLGGQTALIARVGDDVWGPKYVENLKSHNIDTHFVKVTANCNCGIAQINVADNGSNQIVIVAGANSQLSAQDVNEAESIVKNAAVLVLQLETPINTAIRAMQLCNGVSILNGAPALDTVDEELLNLPTIFCVNEHEAAVFTGLCVSNQQQAEAAARHLISKGCNSVLITLGADGAIYLSKEEMFKVNSPIVKCIDSTGAGDAFIGALAYFLANFKKMPIEKCIEAACFIAADSVTRQGTQISFPGKEILNRIP